MVNQIGLNGRGRLQGDEEQQMMAEQPADADGPGQGLLLTPPGRHRCPAFRPAR